MTIKFPFRLKKGDLIALVAPASPLDDANRVDSGVRYLERLGYRTLVAPHISRRVGYLAGTDKERVADLHAMFADRRVKAIFCLRGGYGSPRLLGELDYRLIARHPKIFVGYSDITALLLALWSKCRLVSFHGPMAGVELAGSMDPVTEESFWRVLTDASPGIPLGAGSVISIRRMSRVPARGRLIGGNLSLCASLLGTSYQPDYLRSILFLEDTGEEPYRIDRMVTQLRNAGVYSRTTAVVLGSFTHCMPKDSTSPSLSVDEIMRENAMLTGKPHAMGFPFGHEEHIVTFPVGVRANLDLESGKLGLLEGAVA
jgi:muramoyltetrapeptide carboxypeptidase